MSTEKADSSFQMPDSFVPRAGLGSGQLSDRCAYQEIRAQVGDDPATDALREGDSPVLHAFLITANDSSEELRMAMVPKYPLIVGSAAPREVEEARARLALDWLATVTSTWMKIVQQHPLAVASPPPVVRGIGPKLTIDATHTMEAAEAALLALEPYLDSFDTPVPAWTGPEDWWPGATAGLLPLYTTTPYRLVRMEPAVPIGKAHYEINYHLSGPKNALTGYAQWWMQTEVEPKVAHWADTTVYLYPDGGASKHQFGDHTATADIADMAKWPAATVLSALEVMVDRISCAPNTGSWMPSDHCLGQGWVSEISEAAAAAPEAARSVFREIGGEAAWAAFRSLHIQPREAYDGSAYTPTGRDGDWHILRPAIEDIIAWAILERCPGVDQTIAECRESAVRLFEDMARLGTVNP